MSALSIPVVTISDGVATTLSTNVAEFFGKLHKDVIRSIETILNSTDEKHQRNFAPMMIDVEIGNGAVRKSKAYRLTRDGFTFLAMGFTGERAQAFKWAYIDAFNRMEAQLHGDNLPQGNTLTPAQQLTIQQAVGRRAQKTANHYQTIYRAIKLRYQIAKYDQLPQSLFEDCLKFIETVDLHVPEAQTPTQEMTAISVQPQRDILTRTECERLLGFIYEFRYLHKPLMDAIYDLLKAVKSPLAPGFWELKESWSIGNLERVLAGHGYKVQDLDCYKHLMKA